MPRSADTHEVVKTRSKDHASSCTKSNRPLRGKRHVERMAAGVYWFSCAGHGGCVAVHGIANISEGAWAAARASGKTMIVGRAGRRLYNDHHYNAAQVRVLDEQWEVWIGEEDCDWATIYMAHNDLDGLIKRSEAKGMTLDREYVARSCKSWNPDFYTALTGEAVSAGESSVIGEREFRAEHADKYVAVCASGDWHEDVPEGMVGIVATLAGSRSPEAYESAQRILVSKDDYDARGKFGYVVADSDALWVGTDTGQTKEARI